MIEKTLNITNSDDFSQMIERMANTLNCSCMDAVLDYCHKNDFEIETAASFLNKRVKGRIQLEAEDLHFLPCTTERLPL